MFTSHPSVPAYVLLGVPIWAITPQNEPEFAAPWEACAFNQTYERDFINKYLGPTLDQNHPDVLILAFDHNKDHLFDWAKTVMGGDTGPNGGYVDGMAFHWYTGKSLFFMPCALSLFLLLSPSPNPLPLLLSSYLFLSIFKGPWTV
jgi:O-glycosyl hydrolase